MNKCKDKEEFRRNLITMRNAKRRQEIAEAKKGEDVAAAFKRERVVSFQSSEWRHGRQVMK